MSINEPPFTVESPQDREVVADLARLMYLVYCDRKGFTPSDSPYAPAWALDYAKIAATWLGYDEQGAARVREVVAQ